MLLKYGGENGGHLVEQRADLLFIVLSHGHVFGAPYPVFGKVQLTGRIELLAQESGALSCIEPVYRIVAE